MNKTFVVFAVPVGSVSWFIAHKDPVTIQGTLCKDLPAQFGTRELAQKFCDEVMSKRKAYWSGVPDQVKWDTFIAEIDLPERETERIAVKAAYDARPR